MLAATAASLGMLVWAPAGMAQSDGQATPVLNVQEVKVPAKLGKLLSRGVLVTATCSPDCLMVGKLLAPKSLAAKLGLGNRVVGSSVVAGSADTPATFRIRVRKGARGPLSGLHSGGNLQVRVSALP